MFVLWKTDVKIGSKYAVTLCVCIKTSTLKAGPVWETVSFDNSDL